MRHEPLAQPEDLAARLGETLTGADEIRARAVLDDVSALARKLADTTFLSEDETYYDVPDDVVAVVLAASRRLYLNPNGFASEQDGDYSYRIPAEVAGGIFTPEEQAVLESYRGTSGLWSVQTGGGPLVHGCSPLEGGTVPVDGGWPISFGGLE